MSCLKLESYKASEQVGILVFTAGEPNTSLWSWPAMKDREQADISDIIQQLHEVVDGAITTATEIREESAPYNIAQIDFDRLRKEFERSPAKKQHFKTLSK